MICLQIRDLANSCPRLTMLQLFRAQSRPSLKYLAEAPPLQRLEIIELLEVRYDNPVRHMKPSRLRDIAGEWKRVFPRIRYLPCPKDKHGSPINSESCPLSDEPESDGDS